MMLVMLMMIMFSVQAMGLLKERSISIDFGSKHRVLILILIFWLPKYGHI